MTEHTDDESAGGIWSGPYLRVTVANLTIIAVAAFDGLAVIAALPSIAEDLGDVALLPWVATAYLGASSIAVIVAGPVIDAVGVRRTFRVTGVWFLATTTAVAFAPTLELLLVARVAQGLGGGLVIAVALASVGLAYPHRLRPRAFAANSAVWGLMGFGGPAIAAAVLAIEGWRLIFIAQLPITALALAAGWNALPSTREKPQRIRIDFPGVALLTVATLLMLIALGQIGVRNWLAVVAGVLAVVALALYWYFSGRAKNPVLERQHITRFPLGWVHLTAGLVLAAGLAADNYLPLYVQVTRGHSEVFAAFSVTFLTVGWTIASFVYARVLAHWPEYRVILLGATMLIPSLAVAGIPIALNAPLWIIFTGFFAVGLSIGFVSTAGLTLIQHSSEASEMGRVNAAHQFLRTLGITYGVALGGAVLLLVVDNRIGDVEVVRSVLAGDDMSVGSATADAVQAGLFWATVAGGVLGVGCLIAARALAARSKSE
ncbi:MAG: MFS transporter [Acidimicrobiales bacterium]